jgi:hypothetical protein
VNELICPQPSEASDTALGIALGVAFAAIVLGCAWVAWSRRGYRRWVAAALLFTISSCTVYIRTRPAGFMPTCVQAAELVGAWSGAGATIHIRPDRTFEIPAEHSSGRWRTKSDFYVVSVQLDPPPSWATSLGVTRRNGELRLQPYIDDSVRPDRDWGDGLAKAVQARTK